MKAFFNYYLVLRVCWPVLLFEALAVFALVYFAQGQDVLRDTDLRFGEPDAFRHALLAFICGMWWSWQSWRAGRLLLHFSNFSFWNYRPLYMFRAQVMVPRLLGVSPMLILGWADWRAEQQFNSFVLLCFSAAIWLYLFFHFRRELMVWMRSKRLALVKMMPDYIPIKNAAYPARFIWKKQKHWIGFRLVLLSLTFLLVLIYPVSFSQWLGATAIILSAFGFWLVIISMLTLMENHIRLPIVFSFFLLAGVFSFFNDNHEIRSVENDLHASRVDIRRHFQQWVDHRQHSENDTLPVILLASEGGGIRSAYWTTKVLGYLQDREPEFANQVFSLCGVSGGALGVGLFAGSLDHPPLSTTHGEFYQRFCSRDFLSPLTGWAAYPDMLQRFLPIPISSIDRARALEYSWEAAWRDLKATNDREQGWMSGGFLAEMDLNNRPDRPVLILNGTHVESGNRILISNARLPSESYFNTHQLFDICKKDIPLSTAISCSSRFPYITPPALVRDSSGNKWGRIVDGGYFENLGSTTLLETYYLLKEESRKRRMNVRFILVLIRNTQTVLNKKPLSGFYELASPPYTFARIWQKSGLLGINNTERYLLGDRDEIVSIRLDRSSEDLLPLGWSLSSTAIRQMENQVESKSQILLDVLNGRSYGSFFESEGVE